MFDAMNYSLLACNQLWMLGTEFGELEGVITATVSVGVVWLIPITNFSGALPVYAHRGSVSNVFVLSYSQGRGGEEHCITRQLTMESLLARTKYPVTDVTTEEGRQIA